MEEINKKHKILHFEDDLFIGDFFAKGFNAKGFEYKNYLCPPEKTKELIDLVLSEKPDLIVMDIIMPVMNGIAATKILKNHLETKHIPIIGLDNLTDIETIEAVKKSGMTDYYVKSDIKMESFVAIVRDFLEYPNIYKANFSESGEFMNRLENEYVEDEWAESSEIINSYSIVGNQQNKGVSLIFFILLLIFLLGWLAILFPFLWIIYVILIVGLIVWGKLQDI